MANFNTAEDILRLAIGREIEANVFYNLLTQFVDDPQVRTLCSELASEELEHKGILELELMKLGSIVKPPLAADIKNTVLPKPLDYMLEMARVSQMDLEKVVLLAMEKEKTSFRLYMDLLSSTTDPASRETMMNLAEEEARHKISFEIEYERLATTRKKQ
ncbi:MAG: ferritin family protein [Phycisphaerae bacterium]|jgi:rubrerythrin